MSIAQLINRPCVIRQELETEEQDELGNVVTETVEVETICELQQQPTPRSEAEGRVSDTRWVIFLLPDEAVGLGASIDVDGEGAFEVLGEPWRARNPRTRRYSHIEVAVRRTVGAGESPGGGS